MRFHIFDVVKCDTMIKFTMKMVYYIHQRGEFCICDFVYAQTHHHREDNEGVCACVCGFYYSDAMRSKIYRFIVGCLSVRWVPIE